MRRINHLVAGIDIGGTKTHIALASDGATVGDLVMPSDDWRVRALGPDTAALADAVRNLAGGRDPDVLVVGAHGCDSEPARLAFQRVLASRVGSVVLAVNDAELLLPAAEVAEGIAVIAGTGSIAVARGRDAAMLVAGGWGWLLGDEGSASGIVREAARAVRRMLDCGHALDELGRALLQSIGVDDPIELGRALLRDGSAAGVGRHAPVVFAAAERGSALAVRVIEEAGRALAQLVGRLIARGATGRRVVIGGGVAAAQPRLVQAFERGLAEQAPEWTLTLVSRPPVAGAVALAMRLLRGEVLPNLPAAERGGAPVIAGGSMP